MSEISTNRRRGGRRRLASSAAVALALATPVLALAATSFPNDPFFGAGQQWSLTGAPASINAPPAWCASTGAGITVADVDTGADFGHPDLAGKLIPGARFTSGTGTSTSPDGVGQAAVADDEGHGTLTTGLVVADTGNGIGIAAVAPDAKALIVKVMVPAVDSHGNKTGSGNDSDIAAGIQWAADHGAQVINVSIGIDLGQGSTVNLAAGALSQIPAAIDYAYKKGAAVALAAGNASANIQPFALQNVDREALVVGAVNRDGGLASYSTNGTGVNIYAPGGDGGAPDINQWIVSTGLRANGGDYFIAAGTSLAAPLVAGTLALLMAGGDSAATAMARIKSTAVSRNGLPQMDAAAALGATGTCGSRGTTAKPPPVGRTGGTTSPGRTPRPAPTTATRPPSAAPTPSPSPVQLGLNPGSPGAGGTAPNPPGGPSPLVAAGVISGLLVVGGATFLVRLRR